MPNETQQAVDWAIGQEITYESGYVLIISRDTPQQLVDKTREYFNENTIDYNTFSYYDLIPYLSE